MNNTLILETQYRIYDGLITFGLFICLVIGLPGNCLALKYFVHTKKRNLSTLLYIVACSIDVGSSVIHLPITFSLLKNRNPGLLDNQSFCLIWTFILLLLQQMTIFVVMTLSLSRVIVIKYPFYKVNKRAVLVSIALYLIYHCIWNTIISTQETCTTALSDEVPQRSLLLSIFFMFNYSACLGIPPIIVFLTFLVSIVMLQKDRSQTMCPKGEINTLRLPLLTLQPCFSAAIALLSSTAFSSPTPWCPRHTRVQYTKTLLCPSIAGF